MVEGALQTPSTLGLRLNPIHPRGWVGWSTLDAISRAYTNKQTNKLETPFFYVSHFEYEGLEKQWKRKNWWFLNGTFLWTLWHEILRKIKSPNLAKINVLQHVCTISYEILYQYKHLLYKLLTQLFPPSSLVDQLLNCKHYLLESARYALSFSAWTFVYFIYFCRFHVNCLKYRIVFFGKLVQKSIECHFFYTIKSFQIFSLKSTWNLSTWYYVWNYIYTLMNNDPGKSRFMY